MNPELLISRLDQIGESLELDSQALALIGLGSVGQELERLDAYSDLDFFVIVESGAKRRYLEDLGWLERLAPIAYCFLNSPDGYKLLFADGIFCEFAVFEPDELAVIPFSAGRVVWKRAHVSDAIALPVRQPPEPSRSGREYLLGEILTNLYVGMGRERRGERLSAMRFIQSYAVDRLIELSDQIFEPSPSRRDIFASERRFEQRHPGLKDQLAGWVQGYERNRESALAILEFLESHFEINQPIARAIRDLCQFEDGSH